MTASRTSSGAWATARKLAEQTPSTRNRYVDFLRAVSICVVVIGHWFIGMPVVDGDDIRAADVLRVLPWTQWSSWVLQVIPVFFVVGGYSNAVSWRSARQKELDYGSWAATRMRRLIGPLLPLLIFWVVFTLVMHQLGFEQDLMRSASRAALVPVWFLAVYLLVTAATPVTHRLYEVIGAASFWVFAAAAATTDFIAYNFELPGLRWANYGFVWLAIHQLGFLWRDGRLDAPWKGLSLAFGGLALLILLVTVVGYPIAMISVPGAAFSNSRPPSLALLTLGVVHMGVLLVLQAPVRRWLQRPGPWALTVLVNSRIMTTYLWHLTVMVLLIGVALRLGGIGLGAEPGSTSWIWLRPVWMALLLSTLLMFVMVLGRFEQPFAPKAPVTLATWRVLVGTPLLSLALAFLGRGGIDAEGVIGFRYEVVVVAFVGAFLLLPAWPPRRGDRRHP